MIQIYTLKSTSTHDMIENFYKSPESRITTILIRCNDRENRLLQFEQNCWKYALLDIDISKYESS